MNHIQDIVRRIKLGDSERRIAKDMQISRGTVHKYHEIAKEKGYLEKADVQPSESELQEALGAGVQPPRQTSTVEPYREKIQDWVKQGVEMTAIWLRLQENFSYKGGYSSIRRFVHNLEPGEPEAFVRVHSEPGEDMQVDFGSVGQLYDPVSKRLRTAYVFVATLGYSRHQYAELVFDQKVATWIALHKRAFAYFGGVPKRVIPDNLKAAVLKVLVHDPILGEAYRRMALYYGFLVSPTIPYTPRHYQAKFLRRSGICGHQYGQSTFAGLDREYSRGSQARNYR
jgi:transposase